MSKWRLEDNSSYLTILCDGVRVADAFPYAKSAESEWVKKQAKLIVETMNIAAAGELTKTEGK